MRSGPLVFCATGVEETLGGIAAANRNVRAALAEIARQRGLPLETLVLHEVRSEGRAYQAFAGNTLTFGAAVYAAAFRASLVIFDHVHLTLPALYIPRALRAPMVICAHGSEAGKRIRRASICAFRAADLVLTNSEYTLHNMRNVVEHFNAIACPLGLAPEHEMSVEPPPWTLGGPVLRAADGVERPMGQRAMLLVGRLDAGEREKGHRELIQAMPTLLRRVPTAQLVLAGGGSDEMRLRANAAESEAAASIFLTGQVDHDLLQRLYAGCYAYVMPSRQEGFGLVYLEAMNFAKPCVACRDDGGAHVIVEHETGLLVGQPIDQSELIESLAGLLNGEARAREMGIAGWWRLQQHFTAQAHRARVAAAVRAVLAHRYGAQGSGVAHHEARR